MSGSINKSLSATVSGQSQSCSTVFNKAVWRSIWMMDCLSFTVLLRTHAFAEKHPHPLELVTNREQGFFNESMIR